MSVERRFRCPIAVHLVLVERGRVLLLRRTNTGYADGQDSLVAGCCDGDEPATQAMIREAREEAGITLHPEDLRMATIFHRSAPNWESIVLFFVAERYEGTITNMEPHKHDALRFVPLTDLPTTLVPYVREGIRCALAGVTYAEYGFARDEVTADGAPA
jgi:8-oxo-dGTP pyrophosphatase MutT (NUDIX family)